MGLQMVSLSVGRGTAVPFPYETKVPFLREQKAADQQPSLPGSAKPDSEGLKQKAADLEQISRTFNSRLKFVIDQESKQIIVKVIDNETDKVIKILPPEELQRVHSRIRETLGFLFDAMV